MKVDTRRPIRTPEGARLSVRVAGPPARVCAWLVDLILRGCVYFVLAFAFAILGTSGQGLMLLAVFVGEWLYFALFEGLRGATPGKRLMGLEVVRRDGAPCGLEAAFVRNFVRFVDMLPPPYGLGLVSALTSPEFQRLGDRAAGTIVVYAEGRSSGAEHLGRRGTLPRRAADVGEVDALPPSEPLTGAEEAALVEFGRRAPIWGEERQRELADLLEPLTGTTGEPARKRVLAHAAWLGRRSR